MKSEKKSSIFHAVSCTVPTAHLGNEVHVVFKDVVGFGRIDLAIVLSSDSTAQIVRERDRERHTDQQRHGPMKTSRK